MAFEVLLNIILCLTLGSVIFVEAGPTKGWTEVSHRWPADPIEYFVATEHGHHFIDIKLPERLDSDMKLRLEYYYNYSKIRPDIRLVPCGTSVEVVRDQDEQPKGQWLVHELSVEREACQANPILVYNILLHEAGDVFAWRFVEVVKEGVEATTTNLVTSANQSISLCRPSLCDEKLFKHPRFKSMINGLPSSAIARIREGVKLYLNLEKDNPFRLAFNGGRQQEQEGVNQTNLNACFGLELYMDSKTQLELAIASSNKSINATETLEVIEPNQDADHWFYLKRCITNFLPRLPAVYNNTAMFQFNPKRKNGLGYIIMALKPLGPHQTSTWYEPLVHDMDGAQNQWFFTTSGGTRIGQEMLVEYLRADPSDNKIQVSGINSKAESLDIFSGWMRWKDGDENTWLQMSCERADWIALVEFGWQDQNGRWLQTKSLTPHEVLETSVSADSGDTTNNLVIRYRLEGMVGREYRLRLKLKLKHVEEVAENERESLKLLINRLGLVKTRFQ